MDAKRIPAGLQGRAEIAQNNADYIAMPFALTGHPYWVFRYAELASRRDGMRMPLVEGYFGACTRRDIQFQLQSKIATVSLR